MEWSNYAAMYIGGMVVMFLLAAMTPDEPKVPTFAVILRLILLLYGGVLLGWWSAL